VGTVLLVIVIVVVIAVAGFFFALARKGKRQYEARTGGPGLAPNAPREWAGAHSPEAKLHRRLAAAAKSLDAQPVGDAVTIEQRVTIEQQILQVDQQLVAVAGNGDAVARLEPLVVSVERAVAQLATSGVDMELLKRNQAQLDAGEPDNLT
jgi:heme/copper-type cytochrome/quinol oxidase subunit 2